MNHPTFDDIARLMVEAIAPTAPHVDTSPVLDQSTVELLELESKFPQLLGRIHVGVDAEATHPVGALTTAACYTLYPTLTDGIAQPGARYVVRQRCYRHEPSDDPYRFCSFEMLEVVAFDVPGRLTQWVEDVQELAVERFAAIGLPVTVEVANDPFFGDTGRLLANFQRNRALKHEFTFDSRDRGPIALASINRHGPTFVDKFSLQRGVDTIESACFGVGLNRVDVALRESGTVARLEAAVARR